MKEAVELLRECGMDQKGRPGGNRAAVTIDATGVYDRVPYVNFHTARALERAGLATVEGYGEATEVVLSPGASAA